MPPTRGACSGTSIVDLRRARRSRARAAPGAMSSWSRWSSSTGSCGRTRAARRPPAGTSGCASRCVRSTPRAFQWSIASLRLEQVGAADQVLELADAELRHVPAHLLGDEEEEVDDVLGLALEALAQLRVLRGDADRARVQVAGAHHDAAHRDQRGGGEADLLGAEQRGDHDVAARLHLAVGLDDDAVAQLVHARASAGSRPGRSPTARRPTGSTTDRRRAGAAVVAGDDDVVGVRLRDARGDRADADLGRRASRDTRRSGSRSAGRRSAA